MMRFYNGAWPYCEHDEVHAMEGSRITSRMRAAMLQLVLDPGTSLLTHVLATNDFPRLAPAVVEAYRGARCTFSPVPLDILNAYPTVEA